jgi:hypothetical protein
VAERVNRAVHTETDSRAIEYFVYVDRRQIVSQNVNVTASGQGASIVIHEINQVAGNYLRESKAMGEDVKRDDLKKALEALHEQVTALAGRLPPGPQQEAAARKLKQVTERPRRRSPARAVLVSARAHQAARRCRNRGAGDDRRYGRPNYSPSPFEQSDGAGARAAPVFFCLDLLNRASPGENG